MDSVRTFIRYQSITASDPFDDLRVLEYQSKLLDSNVENEYIEILSSMVSAFTFARTDGKIEDYIMDEDLSLSKGIGTLSTVFKSIRENEDLKRKEKESKDKLSEYLSINQDLDIKNIVDRRILKYNAYKKNNALSTFMSNIIQVGMTIESLIDMEYEQAVNLVNYRAKILEEQHDEQKRR